MDENSERSVAAPGDVSVFWSDRVNRGSSIMLMINLGGKAELRCAGVRLVGQVRDLLKCSAMAPDLLQQSCHPCCHFSLIPSRTPSRDSSEM